MTYPFSTTKRQQPSQTMAMSGFRGPLFAEVFGNIRTQFAQNTGSG